MRKSNGLMSFDKIKEYLSNPPVFVPPEPGRPLILYLTVLDNSFGYVLGQHEITGYRTSVGATPYLLVYGTEAVILVEVEIPSLQIIAEAEIDDDEWVKTRLEQLSLIDEKRLATVCQLYQKRMARAYNKKVRSRKFEVGQQVLKHILPHQVEAKGKFAPNCQGPFIITRVLSNGALYLTDIEGKCVDIAINSNAVKRYYV
ncbi:uncharacterized protein [Nicotiana sylvestris]|uniref:uncharacterized protein n=1 Tax=Nicotiana sylvestris TaxID=4096 RepID=UPI00388CC894